MQEQTKEVATVRINNGKAYKDAYEDKTLRLYIPLDKDGNIVAPDLAATLQCWITGDRNPDIPETSTIACSGLIHCLVKKALDHEFGQLQRTVAYGSLAKMDIWSRTLHRFEAGDFNSFTVYYCG